MPMKKNYVLLLFLFILGSGVFVSCYDDEPDVLADPENAGINEMLNGITDPEVRKAIAWFEEHGQDASLARAGETHPLFSMMIPAWSYAFVRGSNDEYRTVEVPIWAYSRTLFTLPENAIAYDETGNSMYIQSLTRLVILTDKKKGTTQGFFMTLIPSKEYMDAKNFNVYRSTYLSREKDFDGYVYFHELDGSFANGWRYANGKITHTVKMLENSGLARGGHYEYTTYCYPLYQRVCTGYWQTTESGGREYVEVNCYEEYVRDECHTESVWVQDPDPQPGTGGGSGGGYEPGTQETIDTTDMPQALQEQIQKIMKALKGMGLSNKVLGKLTIRMGMLPVGMSATVSSSGSYMDVLFGDTPFVMTLEKDSQISSDNYKLVVAHEFYHLYLYGISRDAGSLANLYNTNQKLQSLLNHNYVDGKVDINGAHHQYMGYDNQKYEQFLRSAFPGATEDFYKYGKWGGGVKTSEEFNNLSSNEKGKINKYLQDNNLEK